MGKLPYRPPGRRPGLAAAAERRPAGLKAREREQPATEVVSRYRNKVSDLRIDRG
jgi:hypothetical protein